MRNALKTYNDQKTVGWTRIGMLLLLYNEVIERLTKSLALIENGDTDGAVPHIVRAERIVLELLNGLNLDYGEIPQLQQRLLIHVIDCVLSREQPKIAAALRVLGTLREGFEGIVNEAVEMEGRGEIPIVANNTHLLNATVGY